MSQLKLIKDVNSQLTKLPVTDGQLILTTDNQKLYIDSYPSMQSQTVERMCINPNADWNASIGTNAFIANKPNFPLNISINKDRLIVQTEDGIQKASTIVEVEEYSGTNGDFIVMGNICKYVLKNNYSINTLTSMASLVLDDIPSTILPKYKLNYSILTNSAQLSDSLIIVFDTVSNRVLITNISGDIIRAVTVLASSYDYIINGYSRVYNEIIT